VQAEIVRIPNSRTPNFIFEDKIMSVIRTLSVVNDAIVFSIDKFEDGDAYDIVLLLQTK
jgi:hypothetical protein